MRIPPTSMMLHASCVSPLELATWRLLNVRKTRREPTPLVYKTFTHFAHQPRLCCDVERVWPPLRVPTNYHHTRSSPLVAFSKRHHRQSRADWSKTRSPSKASLRSSVTMDGPSSANILCSSHPCLGCTKTGPPDPSTIGFASYRTTGPCQN
ncbi:hypothetical protein GQ44DRAFT_183703 [Phaeosphaeriaceae sp. PMI808]|nr:hypothetical protein GQ44DRAFT_183703 [Phaeosphaeriaceae sp. PMI808]